MNAIADLIRKENWEIVHERGQGLVRVYGEEFPLVHPAAIHLKLYRTSGNPDIKYLHLKKAHDYLWPESALTWNHWSERRFKAHCSDWECIVYAGGRSTGKDQPLSALIRTPTGWRTMRSLKIGDTICDTLGGVCTVLAIHKRGVNPVYKVVASDGASALASGTHLWTVQSRKQYQHGVGKTQTISTLDILKNIQKGFILPRIQPVCGVKGRLPIDPWLLGYYIANGSCKTGGARLCTDNEEVLTKVLTLWPNARKINKIHNNAFSIVLPGFITELRFFPELFDKLSTEKEIPANYLFADVESRTKLLQGILDGDGYISGSKERSTGACISLSNRVLAYQVLDLARSLGYRTSISGPHKTHYTKNNIKVTCKDAYKLYLSVAPYLPSPFTLSKHKLSTNTKLCSRTITSVTYSHDEETQCITVSAPNNLYITNDYIPTHNSFDAAKLAILFWLANPRKRAVLVMSTSLESLNSRIYGYCTRWIQKSAVDFPYKIRSGNTSFIEYPGSKDSLHAIKAVAAKKGDDETKISSLIGRHPDEGLMIVMDEATDLPVGLLGAMPNLKSCPLFQAVAIGNSNSKFDLHGSLATPKEGWASINPVKDTEWETTQEKGLCLYFGPYDSPAIIEQDIIRKAALSKIFITQEKLEKEKKLYGGDSDSFWRMVLGFWRSEIHDETVLSATFLNEFNIRKRAEWSGFKPLHMVAGLDPAFSQGGDQCVLRLAVLGQCVDGKVLLDFREDKLLFRIGVSATDEKSIELQIADQVIKILGDYRVAMTDMAVDSNGQGRALAELIRLRAKALGHPIKIYSVRQGNLVQKSFDVVIRTNYELWNEFRRFIETDQIRGLDDVTISQLSSRLIKVKNGKQILEKKNEYKARMSAINPGLAHSPDEADSCALALQVAMINYGFKPGQQFSVPKEDSFELEKMYAYMTAQAVEEVHGTQVRLESDFMLSMEEEAGTSFLESN